MPSVSTVEKEKSEMVLTVWVQHLQQDAEQEAANHVAESVLRLLIKTIKQL